MNRVILACVLVLTLSGCNTIENRASISRMDSALLTSQSTGVAIFSTGADHECVATSTFMKLFDQATTRGVSDVPAAPVDGYASKSDFADHRGNVSAYALLPGKYYLSPVTANPYVVGVKVPAFAFEVAAGETVYLGEIYMPVGCSLQRAFKINDRYERDMAIALRQNPTLAQRAPVKRLLLNGVKGDGGSVDASTPIQGIPVQELFSTPPKPAGAGGVAKVSDAVPQVPGTMRPMTVPTHDAKVDGRWTGTMQCGQRQDGRPSEPYLVAFSMEKWGHQVSVFRKTATFAENLSGSIKEGMLLLTGNGTMNDGSRNWTFRFSAPFAEGESTWMGTGEMRANGRRIRDCTLRMQHV